MSGVERRGPVFKMYAPVRWKGRRGALTAACCTCIVCRSQVTAELEALSGWEARVKRVVALLAGAAPGDPAALSAAALSFYRKLLAGDAYRPAAKLASPVHLFTARDNYVTLGEDYGLRAVCAGALTTRQLPASHRSILVGDAARTIADHVSALLAGEH